MRKTLIVVIKVRDDHAQEDSESCMKEIEEIRTQDYEVVYADFQNGDVS